MSQAFLDTVIIDPKDLTPVTVDWADWLALTEDTIKDFDGTVDGLHIADSWFTLTDCTLKIGLTGTDGGEYYAHFYIEGESGDFYNRTVLILCQNQ